MTEPKYAIDESLMMSNHNIIEELAICVCEQFKITKRELLTPTGGNAIYDARSIFFHLCKAYANIYDTGRLAKWAGLSDSLVHYSLIRAGDLLTTCPDFRYDLNKIEHNHLNRNFAPYNLDVILN